MTDIPPVDTFDLASLESFTADLVAAGLEPIPSTSRRWWRGPIPRPMAELTSEREIRIDIRDGWPFRPPRLFVQGLPPAHVNTAGEVCLWQPDDASWQWTSVEGYFARIEDWCRKAREGWAGEDLALDSHLSFVRRSPVLATFDLAKLGVGLPGSWGTFHAFRRHGLHLQLRGGRGEPGQLAGVWFSIGPLSGAPRSQDEFEKCLDAKQKQRFRRSIEARRDVPELEVSGEMDIALLAWQRDGHQDVQAIAFGKKGPSLTCAALRCAPNDEETLILRAGPDAANLREKTVVMFGSGAIGGHAAVAIAESGVGALHLVDGEQITPGNVVRHVLGDVTVGFYKVDALSVEVNKHAPWTTVTPHVASPMAPQDLRTLILPADLVIDGTGNAALTAALSTAATADGKPLISAALYRGGSICRIRRQGWPGDTPIIERSDPNNYPLIPPAPDGLEYASPEIGCSARVHNAPPASVLAAAALLAQAAVDSLTGRLELPDEVIEVYRALPDPPFDRLGRIRFAVA